MEELTMTAEAAPLGQRLSKAELAYNWIRERIGDHTFDAGDKLVLSQIAVDLDTSVVPVREAIRRLEADGLVTFERNVGARVAMVDHGSYVQSMEAVAILEGAATAQALTHITDTDLAAAEALNEQMLALLDDFDPVEFTRLNHEFHAALFARCPNDRLRTLVGVEWDRLAHLRNSTFSFVPERARESVDEHSRIIALIRAAASADEVERVVRAHRTATLHSYQEATTATERDKS
ncbi:MULTISPECIES: GntR family transcriptional regulator [Brevibacterium]|uniref:GntR family transcriptional regulator n=1 Tax=Brevibacterium TaxID=1696 RepID=UPI0020115E0E|nr:GntR family transcriptional regulator [Brevibacterium sp. W7.2]